MAVAAARGVVPIGFNGFDPACFAPGASDAGARTSIAALAEFNRYTAKTHTGIYRDLAVRKRLDDLEAVSARIFGFQQDSLRRFFG